MKKKPIIIGFIIFIIVILLIVGITVIVNNANEKERKEIAETEEQNKINVPNVIGMTFQEAKEEFAKLELEYVIYPWKVPYNEDIIISQDPIENTRISKGEKVKITLKSDNANNNNNNQLPSYVEKIDYYMAFNMTISSFVKKLNDTSTYDVNPIKDDDFKYISDVPYENGITLKSYLYEQINPANGTKNGKGIVLQVEPSGKIASIRYLSKNGIYTDDVLLQRILNITINKSKDESVDIIEKAKNNLNQSFTSNELHFGYQYWNANGVPAFELFAM